ncbi:MAG: M50 family metallopeptidase [Tetrasphaera jenkinsii]|jgi:putative peptide zinc metalloprotease protein|uniref:Peptidase M50 n=1 Tax=Nostocoides jenkinsii Ben 74 TaxID=1193518 RepID=A0A077M8L6_9MICO|nr:M50 family metallopeptidase [Tetrasphaera jenkinsii]MCI1262599.1 M50 family metallopeptidase [Tetrasphaera jenkinsii]CCI52220.1 membrane hypothetical protein [Tetrasphaera jenkinsii Ben 74]
MSTVAPRRQHVTLRSDVGFSGHRYRAGRHVRLVHDPVSGRCYEFGPREAFLADALRQPRPFEEVEASYSRQFDRHLSPHTWGAFVGQLNARGLLDPTAGLPEVPVTTRADPELRKSSLREGRWVVAPVSRIVPRLLRVTRPLFSPWLVLPQFALVAAMLVWVATRLSATADPFAPLHDWRLMVTVGILSWISLSLHEFGHGVAAAYFGGSASEVGVLFRPPTIFFYCRVDSGGYVTSRRAQVMVALAGVWVNLIVLLPAWAWWALTDNKEHQAALLAGIAVGVFGALVNLIPVPPTDGFKALAAGLGQLDLARDSRACLVASARQLLGKAATPYPIRQRLVYLTVALMVVAIYGAALGLLVWYSLAVLPPAVGAITLAAALAYGAGVGSLRLSRSNRTPTGKEA